jgi:hypothetical protein
VTDQPSEITVQSPDGNVIHLPAFPGARPPITSDNAAEMGKRSAVARREKKQEAETIMRALVVSTQQIRAELPPRAELAGLAEAIVMKMAVQVLTGELAPRSAAEATNIAKAWREILSLEQGTPTEIHEMRDPAKLLGKFTELREKAAERRGPTVPATAREETGP